jgi:hypothetical protein
MILRIILIGLLLLAGMSFAEENRTLITATYVLPPGMFGAFDPRKDAVVGMTRLVGPAAEKFEGTAFDPRAWFEKLGVKIPEEDEAVYLRPSNVFLIRSNRETIDLVGALLQGLDCANPTSLRNEIVVATFKINQPAPGVDLAYPELRKAAGDSWKEVACFGVITKPGQIGRALMVQRGQVDSDARELPQDALGAILEVEDVVGPDGVAIDSAIFFKFRGPINDSAAPLEISYLGNTTLWNGWPQIVQRGSLDSSGLGFVLLYRVTPVWPNSERVHMEKLDEG